MSEKINNPVASSRGIASLINQRALRTFTSTLISQSCHRPIPYCQTLENKSYLFLIGATASRITSYQACQIAALNPAVRTTVTRCCRLSRAAIHYGYQVKSLTHS